MSDSVKWDIKQRIFFLQRPRLDDYRSKWPVADSKATTKMFRLLCKNLSMSMANNQCFSPKEIRTMMIYGINAFNLLMLCDIECSKW